MFVSGAIGGVAGLALVVVGALGYFSASDDDAATDIARRERRQLEADEQRAAAQRAALLDEARKLDDEVTALRRSSVQLGEAEDAVSAALNAAVDLANAGNTSAARAAYDAQVGAIEDLNAKLASARDALARARPPARRPRGRGEAMSDGTPDATTAGRPSRWPLVAAITGVVVLLAGVVVCILGNAASSNASDDLAGAQRRLREQRAATSEAKGAQATLGVQAAKVITDGQALLATADQLAAIDAELVAAARDQQAAGSAARIDDYNRAVERGNAAVERFNALVATLEQQLEAFTADISELDIERPVST